MLPVRPRVRRWPSRPVAACPGNRWRASVMRTAPNTCITRDSRLARRHGAAAGPGAGVPRCAADSEAHALGCARSAVRAAGPWWSCCWAMNRARRTARHHRRSLKFRHRFMAPAPIRIHSPATYAATLERRGKVRAAFAVGEPRYAARSRRWPHRWMAAPSLPMSCSTKSRHWWNGRWRSRVSSMRAICRCRASTDLDTAGSSAIFCTRARDGALMPGFITVSNIDSPAPELVRAGNERVVRPRLADAEFFWEQDRRQPLEARLAGLAK